MIHTRGVRDLPDSGGGGEGAGCGSVWRCGLAIWLSSTARSRPREAARSLTKTVSLCLYDSVVFRKVRARTLVSGAVAPDAMMAPPCDTQHSARERILDDHVANCRLSPRLVFVLDDFGAEAMANRRTLRDRCSRAIGGDGEERVFGNAEAKNQAGCSWRAAVAWTGEVGAPLTGRSRELTGDRAAGLDGRCRPLRVRFSRTAAARCASFCTGIPPSYRRTRSA